MSLPFESTVDFARACEQELSFDVRIPAGDLPRLAALGALRGPARACFAFYRDLQGLDTVAGEISCEIGLICQRCAGDLTLRLSAAFSSTPDREKARSLRLEDKLDLVELNEAGRFELLAFLEDCLLLEVPYVPRHEEGDPACRPAGDRVFGALPPGAGPFAGLARLKRGRDGD